MQDLRTTLENEGVHNINGICEWVNSPEQDWKGLDYF